MTALDLLSQARRLGVRLVQIADNLPLDQLSEGELAALETQAEESEIALEIGTRGIGTDHLLRYFQLAERFASPILRIVVDTATHLPTPAEIVAQVEAVLPRCAEAGITLAIENHDRFDTGTLLHILNEVNSPYLGICLDTVNSFGALEAPQVVIERLGPWAVNLHVKDFAIRRANHMMGFTIEGRPAGKGQLNIPSLLERLGGVDRKMSAILELWTPPEEKLEATLQREQTWAASSVAYLRTLIED